MGCFDYDCECGGNTCDHVGGQLGDAIVAIEVPLSDGTNVYLEGQYEQYGYVNVQGYHFYLDQFSEYFAGWLEDEKPESLSKIFLAKKIWTLSETVSKYKYVIDSDGDEHYVSKFVERTCFRRDIDVNMSKFDPTNLSKYIRADKGIDFVTNRKKKIESLNAEIKSLQREVERLEKL